MQRLSIKIQQYIILYLPHRPSPSKTDSSPTGQENSIYPTVILPVFTPDTSNVPFLTLALSILLIVVNVASLSHIFLLISHSDEILKLTEI